MLDDVWRKGGTTTGCGRSSIAVNKMKKPCDDSPTDQEHKLGDRADQAYPGSAGREEHPFQLLNFGGLTVFDFHFFSVVLFKMRILGHSSAKLHFQLFSK